VAGCTLRVHGGATNLKIAQPQKHKSSYGFLRSKNGCDVSPRGNYGVPPTRDSRANGKVEDPGKEVRGVATIDGGRKTDWKASVLCAMCQPLASCRLNYPTFGAVQCAMMVRTSKDDVICDSTRKLFVALVCYGWVICFFPFLFFVLFTLSAHLRFRSRKGLLAPRSSEVTTPIRMVSRVGNLSR